MSDLITISGGGAFVAEDIADINSNFSRCGLLHQLTTSLNDTQVKALGTTAVTILAGQTGFMYMPQYAVLRLDWTANYTGINALSTLSVTAGSFLLDKLQETLDSGVTQLLAGNEDAFAWLSPRHSIKDTTGVNTTAKADLVSTYTDQPLRVSCSNGGANFTGGNAANVLYVTVLYAVMNLSTGAFVP